MKELLSFQINSKSEVLSSFLIGIFKNYNELGIDIDFKNNYEITEDQFNDYLEIIFFKMQRYVITSK